MIQIFELTRKTTAQTDILDITDEVLVKVGESGIANGQALIFVPGSTAGVTTIEYEPGVIQDLRAAIERIAPKEIHYAHDAAWGDGNGYAHVRAALIGASLVIPILKGQLVLGTWQQVVLLDFDNHGRNRRIMLQISGE